MNLYNNLIFIKSENFCSFVVKNFINIINFNEQGYIVFEGEAYPPKVFSGIGKIGDKMVRCIDAENQVLFHLGYEHDENDIHDVKLLCERFNIPVPGEYK